MALTKISTAMWNSVPHHDTHDFNVDDVLYVDVSANQVGIGTINPASTLHLYSASNTQITFQDSSTGVGSNDGFRVGWNGTIAQMYLFENADMRFATNDQERMRIHSGGDISFRDTSTNQAFYWDASAARLGIGVGSSPSAALHATSSASGGYGAIIYNTSATGEGLTVRGGSTSSQNALVVQDYNGANALFTVQGGGNVGIGTTNPDAKLSVYSTEQLIARFASTNSGLTGVRLQGVDTSASDTVYVDWVYDAENRKYGFGEGTSSSNLPINSGLAHCDIVIDDSKVGIGTANPAHKLQVAGDSTVHGGQKFGWVYDPGNNNNMYNFIQTAVTPGQTYAAEPLEISGARWTGSNTRGVIFTHQTGGEIMTLMTGGNVGIGMDSPDTKLHIYQEAAAPTLLTLHNHQSDIASNNTQGNFIDFKMTDGNDTFTPQARIGMIVNDSDGDGGVISEGAGNFVIYTGEGTNSTGGGTLTEHFRVNDKGNVGIGIDTPQAKLHAYSATAAVNTQEIIAVLGSSGNRPVLQFSESSAGNITSGMSLEYNGNGSGDANYMVINSVANIPRFVVMSGGNVGIGTTGPIDKVHSAGGFTSTGLAAPSNTSIGSVQLGYDGTNGVLRTWNSSPLQFATYGHLQFDTAGSERMRITSGGNVTATVDMRAPIFYDSDNTSYYVNPNSISLFNRIEVNDDIDVRAQTGTWITSNIMGDAIGWNNNYGVYIGSNVGGTHYLRGNGTFTTGGNTYNLWHQGNDGSGSGLDADLLDGSHATGFLSTSYLSGRSISDANSADNYGVTAYYLSAGASNSPVGTDHSLLTLSYSTSWSTQLAADWRTSRLFHRGQSNTTWLSWQEVALFGVAPASGTDLRAPIFYDSNNTGRYLDPASTSSLLNINMNNGTLSNVNHITINDPGVSEGIQWIGGNDWRIYESPDAMTNASGNLQFTQGTTFRFRIDTSGNTYSSGSSRAPIFYDSDNTGYYVDPASTSVLNILTHNGLSPTSGTSIDQIQTYTQSLTLTTSWISTGINGTDLSDGVYVFSLFVNDYGVGGGHYSETYSGIISWYASNTNSNVFDEIAISSRAGHAPNSGDIQLGIQRTPGADPDDLKLMIKANYSASGSSNYIFKFRRMI